MLIILPFDKPIIMCGVKINLFKTSLDYKNSFPILSSINIYGKCLHQKNSRFHLIIKIDWNYVLQSSQKAFTSLEVVSYWIVEETRVVSKPKQWEALWDSMIIWHRTLDHQSQLDNVKQSQYYKFMVLAIKPKIVTTWTWNLTILNYTLLKCAEKSIQIYLPIS